MGDGRCVALGVTGVVQGWRAGRRVGRRDDGLAGGAIRAWRRWPLLTVALYSQAPTPYPFDDPPHPSPPTRPAPLPTHPPFSPTPPFPLTPLFIAAPPPLPSVGFNVAAEAAAAVALSASATIASAATTNAPAARTYCRRGGVGATCGTYRPCGGADLACADGKCAAKYVLGGSTCGGPSSASQTPRAPTGRASSACPPARRAAATLPPSALATPSTLADARPQAPLAERRQRPCGVAPPLLLPPPPASRHFARSRPPLPARPGPPAAGGRRHRRHRRPARRPPPTPHQ